MKRVLFIDRDGTLILEPPDNQVDAWEKLRFYPGVITYLGKIARELEFELVMVTNQDGLGTARFPAERFWPIHRFVLQTLSGEGIHFRAVHIDMTLPEQNLPTRKPGIALVQSYLQGEYDLANSFVIGDRETDLAFARNLGCQGILLGRQARLPAALVTPHWQQIYLYLKHRDRRVSLERKTEETRIQITLQLDGSGQHNIATGLGFLDHMLAQFARHAGVNLTLQAEGDLQVDEHHTVEDTALAIGEALKSALGKKKGIQRYGWVLPMDDALAQVALDLSGRPWLRWEASFQREKIGDLATELFSHFFHSLCTASGMTLHVQAYGENEHHKIEAIFKAVGRALGQAIQRTELQEGTIPSTKGSL